MKNGTAFSQLGRFAHVLSPFIAALESACEGRDPETVIQSLQNRGALLAEKIGKLLDELMAMSDDSPVETDTPVIQPTTPDIPTSFTVGGRSYDLVSFVNKGESSVSGHTMVERTRELEAELGEEDASYTLEHKNEIPAALRGKISMVFPKWRNPDDPRYIACLSWDDNEWYQHWCWLDCQWGGSRRLVRRRAV